jgi:8-oxo-dGTP pyrophosphatase MutT (NUDIX family)
MRDIKKWEILEEKDVSPSKWFPLFVHRVKLSDGKVVEDYYVSKLGDVAMVVAITSNRELVLARQYKHGVREVILELPAGRVGNKTPEEAAKEELREETGIVADELVPIGSVFVAPSKDSTITHGFLLRNARVQKEKKFDDTEDIELVFVPVGELDEKIKSGEIRASDTIALITLARLNNPELFK